MVDSPANPQLQNRLAVLQAEASQLDLSELSARDPARLLLVLAACFDYDVRQGGFAQPHMEEDLDKIATGTAGWVEVMREFYGPFSESVKKAQAEMLVTKSAPEPIGRQCPRDGGELVIRYGRYGKFISCANFPTCRHTEPWLEKIGVLCPKDGGEIVERKTRKGRLFYGCNNYPACDFTSWKRPLAVPCPKCGGLLVIANKREASCTVCEESFLLENVIPEAVQE